MVFFGSSKAVQSRINEAVKIIEKLSTGDYSVAIDTSGNDVVAPLMQALKASLITQERRSSEGRRETDANVELNAYLALTNAYLERIAHGEIPEKINQELKGDFGVLKNNINAIIDMFSGTKHVASENQRVKAALDNVTTNVMIADNDRNIAYMNQSVSDMLVNAENDLRKALPSFNASKLLGSSIDQFHKNPAHQKNLLATFTSTFRTQIKVGARTFSLIANPIITAQGERLGSVVEWRDRTNEVAAEEKVNTLVEAAIAGDLSQRIALDGMVGFTHDIAAKINEMVEAIASPVSVIANYLSHIAKGNMPPEIKDDFKGEFDDLKNSMNVTIGNLKDFIANMKHMSSEHDNGDIDVQIDTHKFQGDYKAMAQGVNNMVNGHIAVNKKAMACIKEFGEGNFDAPMEQLPGKKAFINDIIETVRMRLKALIADTSLLAEAALDGRIQTRADANKHKGDFRKIVEGINATLETIVTPIITVKSAVDSISTAAKEISAGNADLSHRTEQQAASLEETASSMVQQVVETMTSINDSSRKIVDIISVIDGIALQTNILALNAAVEAARAGEQGRGFAVVASEVRNLAQRSAAAAKEIKGLIGDSVDKVEDGSKLVGEAGKTMSEIVTSVKRVADIIAEIATASTEQSSGIDQVNHAVSQMDDVTQQNAALVEQAAAAAESLEEQAQTLSETVAQFRLDSEIRSPIKRNTAQHLPKAQAKQAVIQTSHSSKPIEPNNDEWLEF